MLWIQLLYSEKNDFERWPTEVPCYFMTASFSYLPALISLVWDWKVQLCPAASTTSPLLWILRCWRFCQWCSRQTTSILVFHRWAGLEDLTEEQTFALVKWTDTTQWHMQISNAVWDAGPHYTYRHLQFWGDEEESFAAYKEEQALPCTHVQPYWRGWCGCDAEERFPQKLMLQFALLLNSLCARFITECWPVALMLSRRILAFLQYIRDKSRAG